MHHRSGSPRTCQCNVRQSSSTGLACPAAELRRYLPSAYTQRSDRLPQIDAHFKKLEPPTQFGREYLTYVLRAVTPEGRAVNLGESQVDDEDADVKVTTQLQAFGSS